MLAQSKDVRVRSTARNVRLTDCTEVACAIDSAPGD
jgi:hypothetical protein